VVRVASERHARGVLYARRARSKPALFPLSLLVEASFVRTWIRQLRESTLPALGRAGVLIRPHPQHEEQWRRFDARDWPNVTVYPPAGAIPVDAASKADYFDSIYHSAAVVGINTTAQIESAIVGRHVYTLLASEFRDTQEGTLHFHHLRRAGGGLVHAASDFPEHLAQLDAALRGGDDDGRCRRFVEAFVRPFGIDVPATPKLVEAIESVAARDALPVPQTPLVAGLFRPLLRRWAEQLQQEHAAEMAAKRAERQEKRQAVRERRKRLLKEDARKVGAGERTAI
jgi:hypothetical protein